MEPHGDEKQKVPTGGQHTWGIAAPKQPSQGNDIDTLG